MPLTTSNAAILSAARQAIEVLLRFKGSDVVLTPKNGTVVAKPGGGRDFVPAEPRPVQRIALSKVGADNYGAAGTDDGQYVTRSYVLTGRHDMQIAVGDFWEDAEANYTVDTLDQTNGFKTSADVIGFLKINENLGDIPEPPTLLSVRQQVPPSTYPQIRPEGWSCCGAGIMVDGEWRCCGEGVIDANG
jgi:hypothetical protein